MSDGEGGSASADKKRRGRPKKPDTETKPAVKRKAVSILILERNSFARDFCFSLSLGSGGVSLLIYFDRLLLFSISA